MEVVGRRRTVRPGRPDHDADASGNGLAAKVRAAADGAAAPAIATGVCAPDATDGACPDDVLMMDAGADGWAGNHRCCWPPWRWSASTGDALGWSTLSTGCRPRETRCDVRQCYSLVNIILLTEYRKMREHR